VVFAINQPFQLILDLKISPEVQIGDGTELQEEGTVFVVQSPD